MAESEDIIMQTSDDEEMTNADDDHGLRETVAFEWTLAEMCDVSHMPQFRPSYSTINGTLDMAGPQPEAMDTAEPQQDSMDTQMTDTPDQPVFTAEQSTNMDLIAAHEHQPHPQPQHQRQPELRHAPKPVPQYEASAQVQREPEPTRKRQLDAEPELGTSPGSQDKPATGPPPPPQVQPAAEYVPKTSDGDYSFRFRFFDVEREKAAIDAKLYARHLTVPVTPAGSGAENRVSRNVSAGGPAATAQTSPASRTPQTSPASRTPHSAAHGSSATKTAATEPASTSALSAQPGNTNPATPRGNHKYPLSDLACTEDGSPLHPSPHPVFYKSKKKDDTILLPNRRPVSARAGGSTSKAKPEKTPKADEKAKGKEREPPMDLSGPKPPPGRELELIHECEKKDTKILEASETIMQLKKTIERLETENEDAVGKANSFMYAYKAERKKMLVHEREMEAKTAAQTRLEKAFHDCQESKEHITAERNQFRTQFVIARNNLQQKTGDVVALNDRITALNGEIAQLNHDKQQLSNTVASIDTYTQRNRELADTVQQLGEERDTAQSVLANGLQEYTGLQSTLEQAKAYITNMEAKNQELERRIRHLETAEPVDDPMDLSNNDNLQTELAASMQLPHDDVDSALSNAMQDMLKLGPDNQASEDQPTQPPDTVGLENQASDDQPTQPLATVGLENQASHDQPTQPLATVGQASDAMLQPDSSLLASPDYSFDSEEANRLFGNWKAPDLSEIFGPPNTAEHNIEFQDIGLPPTAALLPEPTPSECDEAAALELYRLRDAVEHKRQQVTDVQAKLAKVLHESNGLQTRVEQAEEQGKLEKANAEAVQNEIAKLRQETSKKIAEIEKEKDKLTTDNQALEKSVNAAETTATQLEDENSNLLSTIKKLEESINAAKKDDGALITRDKEPEPEAHNHVNKGTTGEKQANKSPQGRKTQNRITKQREHLAAAQGAKNSLEKQVEVLKKELAQARARASAAEEGSKSAEQIHAELQRTKAEAQDAQKTAAALEKELRAQIASAEGARDGAAKELADSRALLVEERHKTAAVEKTHAETSAKLTAEQALLVEERRKTAAVEKAHAEHVAKLTAEQVQKMKAVTGNQARLLAKLTAEIVSNLSYFDELTELKRQLESEKDKSKALQLQHETKTAERTADHIDAVQTLDAKHKETVVKLSAEVKSYEDQAEELITKHQLERDKLWEKLNRQESQLKSSTSTYNDLVKRHEDVMRANDNLIVSTTEMRLDIESKRKEIVAANDKHKAEQLQFEERLQTMTEQISTWERDYHTLKNAMEQDYRVLQQAKKEVEGDFHKAYNDRAEAQFREDELRKDIEEAGNNATQARMDAKNARTELQIVKHTKRTSPQNMVLTAGIFLVVMMFILSLMAPRLLGSMQLLGSPADYSAGVLEASSMISGIQTIFSPMKGLFAHGLTTRLEYALFGLLGIDTHMLG